MKSFSFDLIVSLIAGIFVCLIVLPILALFTTTSFGELVCQFRTSVVLSAILISLKTSLTVVFLALCLGIPVAYLLAMKNFKGKEILDTLVDLPISMPPLVAGLALLILLGGNSKFGNLLSSHGIDLIFSIKGIIIAQLFVSTPFLIKSAREAFIMTWTRALGEFGATSMVAGCIPFKTETMTVAIYQNAMSGELASAIAIALLLLVFSFTLLLIFKSRVR